MKKMDVEENPRNFEAAMEQLRDTCGIIESLADQVRHLRELVYGETDSEEKNECLGFDALKGQSLQHSVADRIWHINDEIKGYARQISDDNHRTVMMFTKPD